MFNPQPEGYRNFRISRSYDTDYPLPNKGVPGPITPLLILTCLQIDNHKIQFITIYLGTFDNNGQLYIFCI